MHIFSTVSFPKFCNLCVVAHVLHSRIERGVKISARNCLLKIEFQTTEINEVNMLKKFDRIVSQRDF
jgi:hypothetical protein